MGFMQMARTRPCAELLRDLGQDDDRLAVDLDRQLDRVVDLGEGVVGELDVDDRAGDGDDPAVLQLGLGSRSWS